LSHHFTTLLKIKFHPQCFQKFSNFRKFSRNKSRNITQIRRKSRFQVLYFWLLWENKFCIFLKKLIFGICSVIASKSFTFSLFQVCEICLKNFEMDQEVSVCYRIFGPPKIFRVSEYFSLELFFSTFSQNETFPPNFWQGSWSMIAFWDTNSIEWFSSLC